MYLLNNGIINIIIPVGKFYSYFLNCLFIFDSSTDLRASRDLRRDRHHLWHMWLECTSFCYVTSEDQACRWFPVRS